MDKKWISTKALKLNGTWDTFTAPSRCHLTYCMNVTKITIYYYTIYYVMSNH